MSLSKPFQNEYARFYAGYVSRIPDCTIVDFYQTQKNGFIQLIKKLPPSMSNYRYAPDKWTINQVLIHIIDTERVFCYRALALSRGEQKPIPGYEQDDYMAEIDVTNRTLTDLSKEFETVRDATISLFKTITPDQALRTGNVSDHKISVRALSWIIAGHLDHHESILREKYRV